MTTSARATAATAATSGDLGLPAPESLARGDFELVIRRLADDLAFGSDASRLLGSGLEYAGSRPYVPGDSVRLLHWRLTARTGRPFVREHEALKRTCVHLVVDTSASMSTSSTPRSKHDLATWIASAVGLLALRRLSPVAVVGAGERRVPHRPSLSRSDLLQSLEPLRARATAGGESTRLGEAVRAVAARAERASVILVLSDLHDPDAIPAIRRAAQRHDCAVIHLVDPAEATPLRAGFLRGREPETGRTFLATSRTRLADPEQARQELLRAGADVLRLATDASFLPPLRHFLAARGSRRGGRR